MRGRRFGRLGGDEGGFTLLELTVALAILAIGVVGVAQVMGSAFRTAGAGRSRARAVSVATAEVEALRAMPYAQLVVSDGVTDSEVRVGGTAYQVRRAVTWADDGAVADAYKQVTVQVSWEDESGPHSIHQSSLVYSGGLGASVTAPAPPPGTPGPPGILTAVPVPLVGGVELTWTPPVSSPPANSYVVQYSTDPGFVTYQQVTSVLPAAVPVALVADLAPSTTYHFRVASRAANGNLSAWTTTNNIMSPASSATSCRVGSASVTASAVRKGGASGGLVADPVVTANLIGPCSATVLHASYEPLGDGASASVALSGAGNVRSAALEGTNRPWAVGEHEIKLVDGAGAARATLRLVVCDGAAASCP